MSEEKITLHKGKYLALIKEGHWEYVDRVGASGAAIIAAITPDEKILLVEQYRIPVHCKTIELPAGITGDTGKEERDEEAARRELLEETGYAADCIEALITGAASSGVTSERLTLFRATGLKRVHAGGGIEHEKITVHEVPLNEIREWLCAKAGQGFLIDPKIYAGLYFLRLEKRK